MKKILLKLSSALIMLAIVVVGTLSAPQKVKAESVNQPFGGMVTFTLPCTCSANLAIWFTPLWLGNKPFTGFLVYNPASTVLYANYKIGTPTAWHLGLYIPKVQACYVIVPGGCVLVPSYGTMLYTGTS
jgi:hypothetical protein